MNWTKMSVVQDAPKSFLVEDIYGETMIKGNLYGQYFLVFVCNFCSQFKR